MTYGNTAVGTVGNGYRRHRNWSGNDGLRSEEHAYSCTVEESFSVPVKYRAVTAPGDYPWKSGSMFNFAPGLPRVGINHTINLQNKLTAKIWDKITQSDFNAGVFAGEARESYHTIVGLLRDIGRAYHALRKKQFAKAARVLGGQRLSKKGLPASIDSVADRWMWWNFGVRPMLYDIKSVYELLTKTHLVVKRVRCSASYKEHESVTINGVAWNWQLFACAAGRGEVSVPDLSVADRVGLMDPLSVAWELTRLSWLIDWVIPIGNFLEAFNASRSVNVSNFWVSRYQYEKICTPQNTGRYIIVPFDASAFRVSIGTCDRKKFTKLPVRLPSIENPLGDNLSKWATTMALFRQFDRR